jgi:hypothetical protein
VFEAAASSSSQSSGPWMFTRASKAERVRVREVAGAKP